MDDIFWEIPDIVLTEDEVEDLARIYGEN